MAINQHYNEVLDMLDHLFVYMFNGLKKHCGVPSAAVQHQQGPVLSCLSSQICPNPITGRTFWPGMRTLLCQPHICLETLMSVLLCFLPAFGVRKALTRLMPAQRRS